MTSHLVVDALEMAIRRRFPALASLPLRPLQQYASDHHRRLLDRHGITWEDQMT